MLNWLRGKKVDLKDESADQYSLGGEPKDSKLTHAQVTAKLKADKAAEKNGLLRRRNLYAAPDPITRIEEAGEAVVLTVAKLGAKGWVRYHGYHYQPKVGQASNKYINFNFPKENPEFDRVEDSSSQDLSERTLLLKPTRYKPIDKVIEGIAKDLTTRSQKLGKEMDNLVAKATGREVKDDEQQVSQTQTDEAEFTKYTSPAPKQ